MPHIARLPHGRTTVDARCYSPAMSEDRLAQIIRATADELTAAFNKTEAIRHQGQKGAAREDPVLNFVRGRLPGTVRAVGSSEVIDSTGATSKQQDIVIVDPSTLPFFDADKHRVYPAECVQGVIEVKSRLNKKEVWDACEKIASVKRLPKVHYYDDPLGRRWLAYDGSTLNHRPTLGYVFAYEASTQIETLTDNVIEWCEGHGPEVWPDGLFVIGKGTISWFKDNKPHECLYPGASIGIIESQHPRDVLLNMALSLHTAFVKAWMPPFRLHPYLPTAVLGVAKRPKPPWPARHDQVTLTGADTAKDAGAPA